MGHGTVSHLSIRSQSAVGGDAIQLIRLGKKKKICSRSYIFRVAGLLILWLGSIIAEGLRNKTALGAVPDIVKRSDYSP